MQEILWFTSRAAGVVAMVMLTGVFILGLTVAGKRHPGGQRSAVAMGLHRTLSLAVVAFLGAHVVTAVAETYVSIDWISAIVPFTSGYESFVVGLGTVAVDLLLAIVATSLLRDRLSPNTWKAVHVMAFAVWPVALVHGFLLGTADQWLLRSVTVACAVAGTLALGWRFTGTTLADRRTAVIAEEWR